MTEQQGDKLMVSDAMVQAGVGTLHATAHAADTYRVEQIYLEMEAARTPAIDDEGLVEKVARALCELTGAKPDAPGVDNVPRWHGWAQFARAALKAIQG